LLALVLAAGSLQQADAHGFLLEPIGRQFHAYLYEVRMAPLCGWPTVAVRLANPAHNAPAHA
jgi:hypothetical protein